MDQDTNKLIEEQLETLPEALQRAIAQTSWRVLVGNVAKTNNLDDAKKESLDTETMLVIYGFEPQSDFLGNIMRELSLDIARATMIASDIDKQVFSVILDKANELQNKAGEESAQSIPEPKFETTSIATTVVVERPEEISARVTDKPKTALTFEERKKLVPNIPDNKPHYSSGVDPYREPV